MTLPAVSFDLHPMDIFSICQFLRRFKEKEGPRAIRFILEPDKPIRIIFEPWYKEISCHRSIYKGKQKDTVRIWGRRRLMILERLIPVSHNFKVVLLGDGLPSFFLAEMQDMTFTLGLSGWTSNDWSRAGQFDLMAPRGLVENYLQEKIFDALKEKWFESSGGLAARLELEPHLVSSALTSFTQAGKVIYDLEKGVYRIRELSREPLDMQMLRFSSEVEGQANELITQDKVQIRKEIKNDKLHLTGKVTTSYGSSVMTLAIIDADHRLVKASCECSSFRTNQLRKGPCEHILATRMCYEKQTKKQGL
ncbi:MAG: SWIM zinc finger domain-containing protein [Tannerellaceae bacterium]|nr:SWIM zinc finger domain-containing protein [Tannerellaceae bacterium]